MNKSVSINEDMNEIKYYEKDIIDNTGDYLSTIYKYICTSEYDDKNDDKNDDVDDNNYIILKNGKKVKRN